MILELDQLVACFMFLVCAWFMVFVLVYNLFDFDVFVKVFPDLLVDPQQLLMVTVASALLEMGYTIQVMPMIPGFILALKFEFRVLR